MNAVLSLLRCDIVTPLELWHLSNLCIQPSTAVMKLGHTIPILLEFTYFWYKQHVLYVKQLQLFVRKIYYDQ